MAAAVAVVTTLISIAGSATRAQESAQEVFSRAVNDFEAGRFAASAEGFDRVARMAPDSAPQLWQRGIALYYAGRYADCRRQFESHRTVNPDDVENAVWHFLCVARTEGVEKARSALLPVGPDTRVPMRQVYQMFQGKVSPDAVLMAAGTDPGAEFYAQLYLGLYADAQGKHDVALRHMRMAAADRFARLGGYMHMVARVHLVVLQKSR